MTVRTFGPDFQALLTTRSLGRSVVHLQEVDSTNLALRKRAEAGAPAGTLLVADVQTAGRGREGRRWESPRGGLWFSVLLRPRMPPGDVANLMPLAGQAVAGVLRERLRVEAEVKHPNDVMVGGRKLCGILAEASTVAGEDFPRYVVLGVGLNLANPIPAELEGVGVSLRDLEGPLPERGELLAWLLAELEQALGAS